MNKIFHPFFLFLAVFSFAQNQKIDPTKKLITNADLAVVKYINEFSESTVFKKYYELDIKESTVVGKFSVQELKTGVLDEESVIGYILTYKLKSAYFPIKNAHDLKFDIHLNRNFEVDYSEEWNSDYSPAVEGNLQVKYDQLPQEYHKKFILSQLVFIEKLESKKVLKEEQILGFLKKQYPDKTFREIELSRRSWPPYDVHFEVTQTSCTTCLKLEIPVDSLEVSDTSTVEVRAL